MKKKWMVLTILGIIINLIFSPTASKAGGNETAKIESATETLKEIINIPERNIPPSLLKRACGIAVIPGVIRAGLGVGGSYGQGVMMMRSENQVWSNPCFIRLTVGSIGWQIGVQSVDVILIFKNRKSIESITKGKFTLGADASIAAGPVGRQVGASTDVQFKAEIYSYSKSRGLFAGIAIEGAMLQIDYNSNSVFYGKEDITPEDIFSGKPSRVPPSVLRLKESLRGFENEEQVDKTPSTVL